MFRFPQVFCLAAVVRSAKRMPSLQAFPYVGITFICELECIADAAKKMNSLTFVKHEFLGAKPCCEGDMAGYVFRTNASHNIFSKTFNTIGSKVMDLKAN